MIMTAITKKTCAKCNLEKDVSDFYLQGRGYTSWCKDCFRKYSKQRVEDGRDRESKIKHELKNGHIRSGGKKLDVFNKMVYEIYSNMKKRSYFSHRDFNITQKDVFDLVTDFCNKNHHKITSSKHPFKPSPDRIDSNKGYTLDNIKIVWLIENYCKNTFTEEEVIEFCKRKVGIL